MKTLLILIAVLIYSPVYGQEVVRFDTTFYWTSRIDTVVKIDTLYYYVNVRTMIIDTIKRLQDFGIIKIDSTWFRPSYLFEPQEDITVFELSHIMLWLFEYSSNLELLLDSLKIRRHFKLVK